MAEGNTEIKSVYRVLSMYLDHARKFGDYIKGYIDGKEKLELFLKEYTISSRTKFIIRSSCRKGKEYSTNETRNTVNCTRYGRADRIYWEFNNRNLMVPFTGVPFVTNSSQVKHCQHGAQYYKLKAEKLMIKAQKEASGGITVTDQLPLIEGTEDAKQVLKRRRLKPSKKRNCPAYMYIREVVLFPEFALSSESYSASKHMLRREKSNSISRLKLAMSVGNVATIHRFFVSVPLPEAHADHPVDTSGTPVRMIDPFVKNKIDELLANGYYEIRHIQLIIQDYVREALVKNGITYDTDDLLYPTDQEINDYVYLSSLTCSMPEAEAKDKTMMNNQNRYMKHSIQGEMEKSMQELASLIQSCSDEAALNKAKKQMRKVIRKVKRSHPGGNFGKSSFKPDEIPQKRPRDSEEHIQNVSQYQLSAHALPVPELGHITEEIILAPPPGEELVSSSILPPGVNDLTSPAASMMTTFSRLMESDHDIMPSLVDQVVATDSQFHHSALVVHPEMHNLNPLHNS